MAIFRKTFTALAAGLALAWVATAPAQAQTVTQPTLEKIKASGKVVLGVRETSPPMAYALGANEKYVGYHVELCERVLKEIVPQAKLEYMAVTAQNTLPLVQNGTLDIGCGPTTNNTARQQQVAFAVTTYAKWFVNPIPPKNMSLNLPLGTTLRQLFATPNAKPLETYEQ